MATTRFGAISTARIDNYAGGADPAVGDDSADGYGLGSLWITTATGKAFMCVDPSVGAAVWKLIDPAGGTSMATDPLWDAVGNLAVGTGPDAGAKLTLSVPAGAALINVLGVVNGETTPTWKALLDATAATAVAASASAGTATTASHRDHVHSGLIAVAQTYTVSNGTPDRTVDMTATTIDELANVVAALIADLKTSGLIL